MPTIGKGTVGYIVNRTLYLYDNWEQAQCNAQYHANKYGRDIGVFIGIGTRYERCTTLITPNIKGDFNHA